MAKSVGRGIQGSILGPLWLFFIFSNNLAILWNIAIDIRMFMDETCLFVKLDKIQAEAMRIVTGASERSYIQLLCKKQPGQICSHTVHVMYCIYYLFYTILNGMCVQLPYIR